jgi:hypothetical protein
MGRAVEVRASGSRPFTNLITATLTAAGSHVLLAVALKSVVTDNRKRHFLDVCTLFRHIG